jgi:hypothetical protein
MCLRLKYEFPTVRMIHVYEVRPRKDHRGVVGVKFSMQLMNKKIVPLLFASCLMFAGCASESPRDIQTYNANLNRLKIGMTTKRVSALVGPPIRRGQAVVTWPGTIVEWYYLQSQLIGQGVIKVTFTNGRVSSIQSMSAIP